MPLSQTAIERGNPPPRQKSCVACIKAKRRCNRGQPECLRCSQRKIRCRYNSLDNDSARVNQRAIQRSADGDVSPRSSGLLADSVQEGGGLQPSIILETPVLPPEDPAFLDFGPHSAALDTYTSAFEGNTTLDLDEFGFILACTDTVNNSPNNYKGYESPDGDVNEVEAAWHALCPCMPIHIQKLITTGSNMALIISRQFQYSIDMLKRAPWHMVFNNATPWCHPRLYRDAMPRVMQDAQACCALYLTKNPINRSNVLRTIDARANDIISGPLTPSASSLEILARTQALLLYQIICVFDGDIQTGLVAEQTMPHLAASSTQLLNQLSVVEEKLNCMQHPGKQLAAAGSTVQPSLLAVSAMQDFWESWIWWQSARRTAAIVVFVQQMYGLFRGRGPAHCDDRIHPYYARAESAHLWMANDAVEFALAWTQRQKHYFVCDTGFDGLAEAEASDIDDYGRILLTALLGIDETKAWFVSKGGML